jgi:hypothetical protein
MRYSATISSTYRGQALVSAVPVSEASFIGKQIKPEWLLHRLARIDLHLTLFYV